MRFVLRRRRPDPARAGEPRPGRARRRILVALAAAALACAALASAPILLGRTAPPAGSREAARREIAAARAQDSAVWAPELLRDAEALLYESETEYRRQELRFVSLRNFAAARDGLARAREAAIAATREAEGRRREARATAEGRIADAGRIVGEAETLAEVLPLLPETRSLLQRSRIRLHEARGLFERGDYRAAAQRAGAAGTAAETVLQSGALRASRYVDRDEVAQWRRWIDETVAWSRRTGKPAIVIYKEKNLLRLYVAGRLQRSYHADLGANVVPRKLYSGDAATPEGRYRIVAKKGPSRTRYHRALLLDYPNQEDLRRLEEAQRAGQVAADAAPGGLIEIHGEGGRGEDWTRGCPALSNDDMDDLYRRVEVGTPVTIVGGDGANGRFSDLQRSLAHRLDGSRD